MMKEPELLPLERSFIKFISDLNSLPERKNRDAYLHLKGRFMFSSKEYRSLCENVHSLYEMFYFDANEHGLIDAYKKLEYLHLFRHLSYAFPEKESRQAKLKRFLSLFSGRAVVSESPAEKLLAIMREQDLEHPIVLDYGSGLGHLSYKIGQMLSGTKVYLVDIDSIILRFAEYYFKEGLLDVQVIKIHADNLYPNLPECNVCICNEVLEHVRDPHIVMNNITRSLQSGGLLYGNYDDHLKEFLHVSTDLSSIRAELDRSFTKISDHIYRKK